MEWKEVRLGDIVSIKSGLAYNNSSLKFEYMATQP